MKMNDKAYLCIDLKSFYASVECVERGLDPMTTNLVVADSARTEKTICLAVSPSLKAYGLPGRARLFEVIQKITEINSQRRRFAPGKRLTGKSFDATELKAEPQLELDFITAVPRMGNYLKFSTDIYNIYLRFVAAEDIHVYSIDEVFIDITPYIGIKGMTPRMFAAQLISAVQNETGIIATAGLGTNMYLAKVAMDIEAKHAMPDENGARIAELDEMSYRKRLWNHKPVTDFWRIGKGYAAKLASVGLYTMGDIAKCSAGKQNEYYNEELLYKMFGINAELLIDHAWGYEPCTMADVKAYKPAVNSISTGQVLHCPYDCRKARLIVKEMAELMSLDLVEKSSVTDRISLTIGYDRDFSDKYTGEITRDYYGRKVPKHGHGTIRLDGYTSSTKLICKAAEELFDKIADKKLMIRRINLGADNVLSESDAKQRREYTQLDMFGNYEEQREQEHNFGAEREKERNIQNAILNIKKQFGRNAAIKGMNLKEGATTTERNRQIGGHKA